MSSALQGERHYNNTSTDRYAHSVELEKGKAVRACSVTGEITRRSMSDVRIRRTKARRIRLVFVTDRPAPYP